MSENYFVEFRRLGALVKVTAIDPATGTEATIQGPANVGEKVLAHNAVRKLEYLLRKAGQDEGAP